MYMCHFAMGLTHCYKTTVFTFIFAVFLQFFFSFSIRSFTAAKTVSLILAASANHTVNVLVLWGVEIRNIHNFDETWMIVPLWYKIIKSGRKTANINVKNLKKNIMLTVTLSQMPFQTFLCTIIPLWKIASNRVSVMAAHTGVPPF